MTIFTKRLRFHAAWLLFVSTLTFFSLAGVAQDTTVSAPLTTGEVMARVVGMNAVRAKSLETYTSVRTYHLECHCIVSKSADMMVRANYSSPNTKDFFIISESGSDTVRHKVFRKLLEAEEESLKDDNQRLSAVTPENYTFRLVSYQKTDQQEQYVLHAEPKGKSKFLFRGQVWIDGKDFAITRVQGEPAVNPSWWITKTEFTRTYEKVGEFWLPHSNDSVTKVRIFGSAVLTINYGDYQVTRAPAVSAALSEVEVSSGE